MEDAAVRTLRRLKKTAKTARSKLTPADLAWRAELALWPAEWREDWEERAAIMEYDANLPRTEAEELAFEDVKGRKERNGTKGNV